MSLPTITRTSPENAPRWVPFLITGFTAVFRVLFLAIKPPHFDEGVNGWFIDEMAHTGHYHYDPSNYHGPLHFYILFIFQLLFGRNLWAIRLPIVIISTLTVWLVTRFDRFLDRRTCWIAAIAMAVSPGAEFYGRYAIHESEFVFFLILAAWGALGVMRFGTVRYLWAAAMGITGLVLTKETYIIHFTAFALAVPALLILERFFPSSETFPVVNAPYSTRQLCEVGAVSVLLILFFYSGNFMDFPGLHGLVTTFSEWAKTGHKGNGHEKTEYDHVFATLPHFLGSKRIVANYYWFHLMQLYEWPVLLGVIFSPFYIQPKTNRVIRYLAIYGWGALVAYSIINYKTPWCIITIAWPFFFVFGDLMKDLLDEIEKPFAIPLIVILLGASLAWSARLSFRHYTDENEPYVYVQTFKDINKVTEPLFKLVAEDPSNYHLKGNILLSSYHPLPWMLGDFTDISWYEEDRKPDVWDADFLLVDGSRADEVEKQLKQEYFTEDVKLRASMDPAKLYFSVKKFSGIFPGRKAGFTPPPAPPAAEPAPEKPDE